MAHINVVCPALVKADKCPAWFKILILVKGDFPLGDMEH